MAITIKKNTVCMPLYSKLDSMPWTEEMHSLADKSDRDDGYGFHTYRFSNYEDASRFYVLCLTKPHCR